MLPLDDRSLIWTSQEFWKDVGCTVYGIAWFSFVHFLSCFDLDSPAIHSTSCPLDLFSPSTFTVMILTLVGFALDIAHLTTIQ